MIIEGLPPIYSCFQAREPYREEVGCTRLANLRVTELAEKPFIVAMRTQPSHRPDQTQRVIDRRVNVSGGDGVADAVELIGAEGVASIICGRFAISASWSTSPRLREPGLSSK